MELGISEDGVNVIEDSVVATVEIFDFGGKTNTAAGLRLGFVVGVGKGEDRKSTRLELQSRI